MATTNTSDEQLKLSRPPVDRLLSACVLAASAAYIVFLIVMQLTPREPEDPAKQGYLGVVSGESQPNGDGAEQDPATGTAAPGGSRSAYYIGSDQPPRPVTLLESPNETKQAPQPQLRSPSHPTTTTRAHATPSPPRLGKLALDELIFTRLEQLADRATHP